MYHFVDFELEKEMDKAYHYLAHHLDNSGHNSKPVLMHSIAVSMTLYHFGYKREIVLAGILHDLIEDTDIEYSNLVENFGKEIADIVKTVSFDSNIVDKIKRTDEVYERIAKYGMDAIILKCSDLYANLPFLRYVESEDMKAYLIYKYSKFIKLFGEGLKTEPIYQVYYKLYNEMIKD